MSWRQRLTRSLEEFIGRLETQRLSFGLFIVGFLSIVSVRNFLETFSDLYPERLLVKPPFQFLVHFPLNYALFYLSIVLVLTLFLREDIRKVGKVVFFFLPVLFITPIIDLITTSGRGANIDYLYGNFTYLLDNYRNLLYTSSREEFGGITWGIRVESYTAILLLAAYVYIKSRNILKTVVALPLFYTVIFLIGSLPSLFVVITGLFTEVPHELQEYVFDPQLFERFYSNVFQMGFSLPRHIACLTIPLIVLELCIALWLYDPVKLRAIVRNIRPYRVLHFLGMFLFGVYIGKTVFQFSFSNGFEYLILVVLFTSVLFSWLFATGVNDIMDLKIDAVSNRERPLVKGILSTSEAVHLSTIYFVVAVGAAACIGYPFFILTISILALTWIYSVPPFRLRRFPLVSSLIVASSSVLVLMLGFIVFDSRNGLRYFPAELLYAVLPGLTLGINIKDLKDSTGDRSDEVSTLLTVYGEKKGRIAIAILTFIAYIMQPPVLGIPHLMVWAVLFGSMAVAAIVSGRIKEKYLFIVYLCYLLLLGCHYIAALRVRIGFFGTEAVDIL